MNVSNTIKIALDFVSPFNAKQFHSNVERMRRENEREDYIGIQRTLHTGLTRALKILHGGKEIAEENSKLKEELEQVFKFTFRLSRY